MRHVPTGATAALAAVCGYAALYRLGQTWGATNNEQRQPLAGDELLPDAAARTTHAITITAPADAVWPWLVQMGWGRAGWYTYRWVDRLLFPANGPSADRIQPELQQLEVGDRVPDGPPATDCWFTVERLEPDRLLVLRSTRHLPLSWRQRGLAMDWIWSWQLDASVPGRTRVVQRNRMRLQPWWFERAFLSTIVPADFVMARSHLRGLQRRAEASRPGS
ncbi:MAG TPA: SRPBCC family protein [Actinomycetes bacterium]|nr:SRPBCC family protein [Actinomycetes bacterium]